jgi:hypothetical protein
MKETKRSMSLHTLTHGEPPVYYVLRDGRVMRFLVSYITDDERKILKDQGARILRRAQRRAAVRAARKPWPVLGTAPAQHRYE